MGSALAYLYKHYAPVIYERQWTASDLSPVSTTLRSARAVPFYGPPDPEGVSMLPQLMDEHQQFLYSAMAMMAVLIYEYFITLDMEVEFIWKSKPKITLSNGIFMFNRYFPLLRVTVYMAFSLTPARSGGGCDRGTDFNSYATMFNIAIVELLMLFRAWTLFDKSKPIGAILAGSWLSAVGVCIVVVRSNLHPIPGVIPLPPMWFLPCDRPSPFKYFVEYIIALTIELISLSFMMGRISYLALKSKKGRPERAKESDGMRVLRALRRQGAMYFAAAIFVMTFSVISSFIKPLARNVVNAGVAPTFTSIACNRFVFALRGVYLEINGNFNTSTDPPSNKVKFEQSHIRTVSRRHRGRRRGNTNNESVFGPGDIAETRHDFTSRDIKTIEDYTSADYDEDDEPEKSPQSQTRKPASLAYPNSPNERRTGNLAAPLHAHGTSSSIFLASDGDSSIRGARSIGQDGENDRYGGILQAISFTHNPRSPSSTSSKFGFGAGSVSTHGPNGGGSTKANSPERRSPLPSMPFPPDLEGHPQSPHSPQSPDEVTDGESGKGLGGKLGSMWWKRKQSSRKSGTVSYGEVNQGENSPDVKARPRGRERHPLDHHYEMDTIHSQIISDGISEIDDEEMSGFHRDDR